MTARKLPFFFGEFPLKEELLQAFDDEGTGGLFRRVSSHGIVGDVSYPLPVFDVL